VIKRAATEEGLWERLHAGIEMPPAAEVMVEGMMGVYGQFSDRTVQTLEHAT
jgi:hypothetical protein